MRRVFLFLVWLAVVGPAVADPRDDLVAAFGRGDRETALRTARPLAERDDVLAQYLLGKLLREDAGTRQEAAVWLRKAAEKGHVAAQGELGYLLAFDLRKLAEGRTWIERAVQANNPPSFRDLGWIQENEGRGEAGLKDAAESYRRGAELNDRNAKLLYANALLHGRGVGRDPAAAAALYCTVGTVPGDLQCAKLLLKGSVPGRGPAEGIALLRRLSERGSADARVVLAEYLLDAPPGTRDIEEAVRLLHLAADQGHADALFDLGWLASRGIGGPKDLRAAFDWYGKAAAAGQIYAYGRMGMLAAAGLDGKPDPAEALRLFRLGAEHDDPAAQERLAIRLWDDAPPTRDRAAAAALFCRLDSAVAAYGCARAITEGEAVEKDRTVAVRLFRKAAAAGHVAAQAELGHRLLSGIDVDKDVAEGVRLTKLAAERGSAIAYFNMGAIRSSGLDGPPDFSEALRWYGQAAAAGIVEAHARVGRLQKYGPAELRNLPAAYAAFKTGADLGSADALVQQGVSLRDGTGVARDEAAAAELLCRNTTAFGRQNCARLAIAGKARGRDKAAGFAMLDALVKEGDAGAMTAMAYYTLNGIGTRKDVPEAKRYVELAVAQGDAAAMFTKGAMIERGLGYKRDFAEAVRWYERAAEQDRPEALLTLGRIYEKGRFGKADANLALGFYRRAAEKGNAEAEAAARRLSRRPGESTVLDFRPPP